MTVNGQFSIVPVPPAPVPVDPIVEKLAELRRLSPAAAGLLVELVDAALVRLRERPTQEPMRS